MHNDPLVTVICLCYNHSEFVVEALESVLKQTHSNMELIIADDFSTDNSVEIIQNWLLLHPEIRFIANSENLGNTKTFNKCLAVAKGEYIIDLAADDLLKFDCAENQLKGFRESKFESVGLIYGNAELISDKGIFIKDYFDTNAERKTIKPQKSGDIYIGLLNGENQVCSISAMIKREVFDTLNGYDENLAYEDYDFWIRASHIYNFDYVDKILVSKRVLDNSLYTLVTKKNNARARQFNYSTYLILLKAFNLNGSKSEFKAMLKRIHFEMTVAYKTRDFKLLLKYIILELKVRLRT